MNHPWFRGVGMEQDGLGICEADEAVLSFPFGQPGCQGKFRGCRRKAVCRDKACQGTANLVIGLNQHCAINSKATSIAFYPKSCAIAVSLATVFMLRAVPCFSAGTRRRDLPIPLG